MSSPPDSRRQQLLSSGRSSSQRPSETCMPQHSAILLSNHAEQAQQQRYGWAAELARDSAPNSMQQAPAARDHVQQLAQEEGTQPEGATAAPQEHVSSRKQSGQAARGSPRRRGRPRKLKPRGRGGRPPKAAAAPQSPSASVDVPIELSPDHPILQGSWQEVLRGEHPAMVLAPLLHSISSGDADAALTFERPPAAFAGANFYHVDACDDPAAPVSHKDSDQGAADDAGACEVSVTLIPPVIGVLQSARRPTKAVSSVHDASAAGASAEQETVWPAAHRSGTASTETDSHELHAGQRKRSADQDFSSGGQRGRPRLKTAGQEMLPDPRHQETQQHASGSKDNLHATRPGSIHDIDFPPNHVLDQLAMPDVHDMGFLDDVPASTAQHASAMAALETQHAAGDAQWDQIARHGRAGVQRHGLASERGLAGSGPLRSPKTPRRAPMPGSAAASQRIHQLISPPYGRPELLLSSPESMPPPKSRPSQPPPRERLAHELSLLSVHQQTADLLRSLDVELPAPRQPAGQTSEGGAHDTFHQRPAPAPRHHHWEADYEDLLNLRHSLSQLGRDQAEVLLYVLDLLQHLPMTTLLLQQTQIGATVKALRQHADAGVANRARYLLRQWKAIVKGTAITSMQAADAGYVPPAVVRLMKDSHAADALLQQLLPAPMQVSPAQQAGTTAEALRYTSPVQQSMQLLRRRADSVHGGMACLPLPAAAGAIHPQRLHLPTLPGRAAEQPAAQRVSLERERLEPAAALNAMRLPLPVDGRRSHVPGRTWVQPDTAWLSRLQSRWPPR